MQKEEFARLLTKYNAGHCTDAEIRLIDRWYDQLGTGSALALSEEDRQKLKKKLWHQIDLQTTDDLAASSDAEENVLRWPWFRRWVAAAAVVALIGFGSLLFYRYQSVRGTTENSPVAAGDGFVEQANKTAKPLIIELEDGSIVHLQPQSTIRYATQTLPHKREIWLNGKAFFRVHKDASRPFLVYSGAIVTRVLGTSFWITAPTNAPTVEVAVHTGKVAVFKKNQQSTPKTENADVREASVVLTPNQKVTIFLDENRLTRGLIDQPEPIQTAIRPEPATFAFDNSTLPDVLKQLEKTYGIEMVIGNDSLAHCRFTGKITHQPLYSKLELLCRAINAQYEVQGNRILITGVGCDPSSFDPL
ncbi:FecR family protein [Larkinella sp. GY13]|uniref:FecR family protein n=1 Tax=Larkinella sp. GY13 TaxID=3453720 RepID=UPI003EED3DBF